MPPLKYVGPPIADNGDVVYRSYPGTAKQADPAEQAVRDRIAAGFVGYATQAYVEQRDALLATKAYADGRDALRIPLSRKGVTNGIPVLEASGRVSPSRIYVDSIDQPWVRGLWSPAAYNASSVVASSSEQQLYTCQVTDPGYPYRLVVFGSVDARCDVDTEWPVIRVRVGGPSGQIIGLGLGEANTMEKALWGDMFSRDDVDLGGDWLELYTEGHQGHYYTNGNELVWEFGGSSTEDLLALRSNGYDRHTGTNFQRIVATIGSRAGDSPGGGTPQHLRIYARVNDTATQYVCFQITHDTATCWYRNGGAEAQMPGSVGTSQSTNTPFTMVAGTPENPRTFYLYKGASLIMTVPDSTMATAIGPNNRGWGFGARAGSRLITQNGPPRITSVTVNDEVINHHTVGILPRRVDSMPVLTGPTTLHVSALRSAATGQVTVTPRQPALQVLAVPA